MELSKQDRINRVICSAVISAVKGEMSKDKDGFIFEDNKISCTEFKEALEYTISQLQNLPLAMNA